MKRKEVVIVATIVALLATVNLSNFIRKQHMRQNYRLIIEAGKIKLSLNDACMAEFEDLPGIGPVLAERIVDYREKEGGYESLEELKNVKGIGDNLYQRILPYIRL